MKKMSSMKNHDKMMKEHEPEMLREHAGYFAADKYKAECWCEAANEHEPNNNDDDETHGGY